MIANATEAVEALRHKQTGEVLPTKNLARNTKLVYYADELVALKFHKTEVAHFTPDGVVIDTRDKKDDANDRGWFTLTTWERIDSFTPAQTFTNGGLRHVLLDPSAGYGTGSTLYTHGLKLDERGRVLDPGIEPEIAERVCAIVRNMPAKLKRHAQRTVENWVDWNDPLDCCTNATPEHYLTHIEANEYVPIPQIDALAQSLRACDVWGTTMRKKLVASLADNLRDTIIPVAIEQIAPGFTYPQLPRRRV